MNRTEVLKKWNGLGNKSRRKYRKLANKRLETVEGRKNRKNALILFKEDLEKLEGLDEIFSKGFGD